VDLLEVSFADCLNLKKYDGVIAGAPVHMSKYPKIFRQFILHNSIALAQRPTAFFSVCLGILEKSPQTQKSERQIVRNLFAETGWYPQVWTIFAGALKYSQYGWLTRQMMRMIAARGGGDTSTAHDYEYTDWNAVRQFAEDFIQLMNRPRTTTELTSNDTCREWNHPQ
jgi:menaquinone-dependent protoporphyrinogen oxidase